MKQVTINGIGLLLGELPKDIDYCHWCKKSICEGVHLSSIYYVCAECEAKNIQDMNAAFEALAKVEQEVQDQNKALLKTIGRKASYNLNNILYGCDLSRHEPLSIVDSPKGSNQDEKAGCFKEIWVQQWSVGMEGDSYSGYIYARFAADKWLKIPYSC